MPLCPSTVVLDTAWQGTDLSMSHMEITASDDSRQCHQVHAQFKVGKPKTEAQMEVQPSL